MNAHTKTPWAAEQIGVSSNGPDGVDVFDIGPVDSENVMRVRVATVAGDDAAFICKAVNAHADLLDALERCAAVARSNVSEHQREITGAIVAIASAAIAKAA